MAQKTFVEINVTAKIAVEVPKDLSQHQAAIGKALSISKDVEKHLTEIGAAAVNVSDGKLVNRRVEDEPEPVAAE